MTTNNTAGYLDYFVSFAIVIRTASPRKKLCLMAVFHLEEGERREKLLGLTDGKHRNHEKMKCMRNLAEKKGKSIAAFES